MRKLLTVIFLLVATNASAFSPFEGGFGFGGTTGVPSYFSGMLLSSLTPVTGASPTFTRNSTQWYFPAGSSTLTSVSANVPAFETAGYLSEPARTNKATARKHNPVDTTNVLKAGDAASVLSVVDDTAALTAAGLMGVCTNGKVYKLDNSAGTGVAYAEIVGPVGNLNAHSAFAYMRIDAGGTSTLGFTSAGPQAATTSTTYTKLTLTNYTPTGTAQRIYTKANAASVVYFILPQLEEGPTVSSVIAGDTLATVTRQATVASYPTTNIPAVGPWAVKLAFTPKMAGSATSAVRYLFSVYTDANNETSILYDGTTLTFRKRIGGVNYDATKALTTVAGTTYNIVARWTANGTDIFAQGAKGAGNSNTAAPVIGATFQLGSSNGTSQAQANFSNLTIYGNIGDSRAVALATP